MLDSLADACAAIAGKPKVPRKSKLPDGWCLRCSQWVLRETDQTPVRSAPRRDYLADPTIHLIWILNPKLLEARQQAIQSLGQEARPLSVAEIHWHQPCVYAFPTEFGTTLIGFFVLKFVRSKKIEVIGVW